MTRLNLMLLLAVVVSAMFVVHTQYQSRRLYVELEQATALTRKLEIDNERLDVLRRAESRPLLVEKIAKDKLQMRAPAPGVMVYLADSAAAPSQPAASASRGGAR